MVVWIELAFVENFLLDGVLLYLAERCARLKIGIGRLIIAATLGAAEAIVFPLFVLPVWAAYTVKVLGGIAICTIAFKAKKSKQYVVSTILFFLLTFALGGLLVAIYSFFDIDHSEYGGFIVESAPVGLVLGGAATFAILIERFSVKFYAYRKNKKNELSCELVCGERRVTWQGFLDSGNCLTFHGAPVCVVTVAAVFALFGSKAKEVGRIVVGTVNGSREASVFQCDRMTIMAGKKTIVHNNVFLTVGEISDYCLILNTALLEA